MDSIDWSKKHVNNQHIKNIFIFKSVLKSIELITKKIIQSPATPESIQMAEDIFMNYAASSSPIDSDQVQAPKIQLNITKFGNNFDEILFARDKISTNLKSSTSGSSQETRLKILQLRQFNRHLSNLITEHRKRLNELKEIVDTLNSKLLCEKFEKQHLLDEIKTCLNSK